MVIYMTEDDIVVGLKVVRIERAGMTTQSLMGKIWTVELIEKKAGLVRVTNKEHWQPFLGSRLKGFWTRWAKYEEPNDTLKQMV